MKNLPRPTARGRMVLLVGALASSVGAPLGFTDITRAGMFALALVVLAWVFVALQTTRALPVSRHLRDQNGLAHVLRVGQTYTVDLFVAGHARDGALIEHQSLSDDAPSWPMARDAAYAYEVTPRHRGQFIAGPASFNAHDPLHLVAASSRSSNQHTWLVWPKVVDIEHDGMRHRADGDETLTSSLAHYAGSPGASIREYAHGDDLRIVHWPASAHNGELMVRQFDPPADARVVLTFSSALDSAGADAEWEWLISGAASLFVALLAMRVTTSILTTGDEAHEHDAGLDALARLGATQAPSPLPLAPTVLFAHSSSPQIPEAPHGMPALALVCGPRADALATQLETAGWQSFFVDTTLPVGEEMSYLLERLRVR